MAQALDVRTSVEIRARHLMCSYFFLRRDDNLVSIFDERKKPKIEIFNFLAKNILLNRETTGYTNDSV